MGCVERTLLSAAFDFDSAGPFCKGQILLFTLEVLP